MKKTQKEVNVLYTYKWNHLNRICFTVLSSNEKERYNTCFDKDENHGSCTCRGGDFHNCYHLDQLKARAAEYFQSRKPAQPVQPEVELTAEDIASLVDPDIDATQPEKANPVAEAEAFIARVQAEKAALHNSNEQHFEVAPSGRACPMR